MFEEHVQPRLSKGVGSAAEQLQRLSDQASEIVWLTIALTRTLTCLSDQGACSAREHSRGATGTPRVGLECTRIRMQTRAAC